jgi:hypothetical protein
MARLALDHSMPYALEKLDALVADNEGKQDAEAQDLIKQRAVVRISLIAVSEIMYRADINVESKLLRRMTQDAISSEVITAEESPADIVERIAKIMRQSGYCVVHDNLFAQEVFKNVELAAEEICPRRIVVQPGQEDQARNVIPLINCQDGMLAQLNKIEEVDKNIDNKRPLMFGGSPMINVENVSLGRYADGTDSRLGAVIETAVWQLFKGKKIHKLFEWNGDGWQAYSDKQPVGVVRRTVYRLTSAIIRTKWNGADEYLFVHWPIGSIDRPFVKGKQWIDAFDAAIKAGEKPSLGEVCTLFYFYVYMA